MKVKKSTAIIFIIYILLCILCFFQCRESGTVCLILTGIIFLIAACQPFNDLVILMFVCLPFFNVLNKGIGSKSMFYVFVGIVTVRYLFSKEQYEFGRKIILLCAVVIFTAYNLTSTERYFKWIIMLIPLVLLYKENAISDNLTKVIELFSFSTILASIWGLIMMQTALSVYTSGWMYNSENSESIFRFAGLIGDAVWFGIQMTLIISFNLVLLLVSNKNHFLHRVNIIACFILGILTYSKTFFICVSSEFIIASIYYFSMRKTVNLKMLLWILIVAGVLCGGIMYILSHPNNYIVSTYLYRFQNSKTLTGRTIVWRYYLNMWKNTPSILFKGIGFDFYGQRRTFVSLGGRPFTISYSHNIFIETVTAFGLTETLIILFFAAKGICSSIKKHHGSAQLIPVWVLMICGMVSHGHFEFNYYCNILLVISIACIMQNTKTDAIRRNQKQ